MEKTKILIVEDEAIIAIETDYFGLWGEDTLHPPL